MMELIYSIYFVLVRPLRATSISQGSRPSRSTSNEREQSTIRSPTSLSDPMKTRQRSQTPTRGDRSARSPVQLNDDGQRHTSRSPQNNNRTPRSNSGKKKH